MMSFVCAIVANLGINKGNSYFCHKRWNLTATEKNNIRHAIQEIAWDGMGDPMNIPMLCTGNVNSVDVAKRSCNVTITAGMPMVDIDVRLLTVNGDGLLLVPAVDSDVSILYSKNSEPIVVAYSTLEKLMLNIGNGTYMSLTVDSSAFVFNGGDNDGMVLIKPLVEKINRLENDVNNYKTLLNGVLTAISAAVPATPVLNSTLSGYLSPLTPYTTQLLTPITMQADLENKKIKQ